MLAAFRRLFAGSTPADPLRGSLWAKYDAAQTTRENRRHWANADGLHAVSANSPDVRHRLRIRSQYEHDNNCYFRGLVSTIAGDVVGTGPRVQVLTKRPEANALIELEFARWARRSMLFDKLRVLEEARRVRGECFGRFTTNRAYLDSVPVSLDLKLIEADQVADPTLTALGRQSGDDGVNVDADGNVVSYSVLRSHPGDQRAFGRKFEADVVPADRMLHWFRPSRPGQLRGMPELAAALPLFAQLRRFALAVLMTAETAASISGVLETTAPPGTAPQKYQAFEEFEIVRNLMLTLPAGWKANPFKPEQPTTGFQAFVDAILREIGRCLDVPFGIVAGDSSRYNYSSARLDHQGYDLRRDQDRERIAIWVLDRVFREWFREASLVHAYLPDGLGVPEELPITWHFDGRPSLDPVKDMTANDIGLRSGAMTLAKICAQNGDYWQDVIDQQAKEAAYAKAKGLTLSWTLPPASTAVARPQPDQTQEANGAADQAA